jgi:hypothetical protein
MTAVRAVRISYLLGVEARPTGTVGLAICQARNTLGHATEAWPSLHVQDWELQPIGKRWLFFWPCCPTSRTLFACVPSKRSVFTGAGPANLYCCCETRRLIHYSCIFIWLYGLTSLPFRTDASVNSHRQGWLVGADKQDEKPARQFNAFRLRTPARSRTGHATHRA